MERSYNISEEEILKAAGQGISEYLSGLRALHREFNLTKCMDAQAHALKDFYKECRGIGRWGTLKIQDLHELDALYEHFSAALQEQARKAGQKYMKELLLWQINGNTARALLVPAFAQAGLPAAVDLQRHRARVKVRLGSHFVQFYVRYKDLVREGMEEELIQAVLNLRDVMDCIGGDIRISR